MSSFEGECTAKKVEKKTNKYHISWSCKLGNNLQTTDKLYNVNGKTMTETFGGMQTIMYRCK